MSKHTLFRNINQGQQHFLRTKGEERLSALAPTFNGFSLGLFLILPQSTPNKADNPQ